MLIVWIRKKKTNEGNILVNNDKESQQKHNESMKSFHLSHAEINEAGSNDITTADGNILAPVYQVKLRKYTQN